jgi:Domain of unknown function (DUF3883)
MSTKGVPSNPPGMHRDKTSPKPAQAYKIYLKDTVGGRILVGYSRHPETASEAEYWVFTDVSGTTWKERGNRHYFGMLRLKEEYGIALTGEAQAEAAKADGIQAPDGPGRENDPLVRRAVERYAEDCAKRWLEGQGWMCERIGAPYDLRCTKGDQELHAEVKGAQGNGKVVKLTRNEVLHNQESCTWDTCGAALPSAHASWRCTSFGYAGAA